MRTKDDFQRGSLPLPENENSAKEQENEESAEEHVATRGASSPTSNGWIGHPEEDAEEEDEYVKANEDEEGSEYYLYRLDRLLHLDERDEVPRLHPQVVFGQVAIEGSALPIQKEEFHSRLKRFLKEQDPDLPAVSSESADFLFERAVNAHMHIAAWNSMVKKAKHPEADRSRRYLREELNRYTKIRVLLRKQRQTMPSWVSDWAHCWIGAFEEIQEEIEGQLRSAKHSLDLIFEIRKSARLDVNALLWIEKKEIRKHIESTSFRRKLEVILAAFAYAAKLVPEPSNGMVGYLDLIKQRVSRVSRSQGKHTEAYTFFLRTAFAMIPSGPELGDRTKPGA